MAVYAKSSRFLITPSLESLRAAVRTYPGSKAQLICLYSDSKRHLEYDVEAGIFNAFWNTLPRNLQTCIIAMVDLQSPNPTPPRECTLSLQQYYQLTSHFNTRALLHLAVCILT